jgi:hypothetical protein
MGICRVLGGKGTDSPYRMWVVWAGEEDEEFWKRMGDGLLCNLRVKLNFERPVKARDGTAF